jgi:hypothetical protein
MNTQKDRSDVTVFLCPTFVRRVHGKTSKYTKQVIAGVPKAYAAEPF